jgi:hypothetical protein
MLFILFLLSMKCCCVFVIKRPPAGTEFNIKIHKNIDRHRFGYWHLLLNLLQIVGL